MKLTRTDTAMLWCFSYLNEYDVHVRYVNGFVMLNNGHLETKIQVDLGYKVSRCV